MDKNNYTYTIYFYLDEARILPAFSLVDYRGHIRCALLNALMQSQDCKNYYIEANRKTPLREKILTPTHTQKWYGNRADNA